MKDVSVDEFNALLIPGGYSPDKLRVDEAAVKLAHTMEDVFVTAQKENLFIERNEIDVLLKGVDILTAIANIPETDDNK